MCNLNGLLIHLITYSCFQLKLIVQVKLLLPICLPSLIILKKAMYPLDRKRSTNLRVKLLTAMKKRKVKKLLRNPYKYQRKLKLNLLWQRRCLSKEMLIQAVKRRTLRMRLLLLRRTSRSSRRRIRRSRRSCRRSRRNLERFS